MLVPSIFRIEPSYLSRIQSTLFIYIETNVYTFYKRNVIIQRILEYSPNIYIKESDYFI